MLLDVIHSTIICLLSFNTIGISKIYSIYFESKFLGMTQGKIDLRNESGRPTKVKVVGEVSET